MTHLCMPPMTSTPPSRRSKKVSRYHVIAPRYSRSGGACGSKVANSNPLYASSPATGVSPHCSRSSAPQPVAAMAANIQKSAYSASAVAHDQNRVFANIGSKEVSRIWNLALMSKKRPAPCEDPLELLFIDFGIDEDAMADQTVLDVDPLFDIASHRLSSRKNETINATRHILTLSEAFYARCEEMSDGQKAAAFEQNAVEAKAAIEFLRAAALGGDPQLPTAMRALAMPYAVSPCAGCQRQADDGQAKERRDRMGERQRERQRDAEQAEQRLCDPHDRGFDRVRSPQIAVEIEVFPGPVAGGRGLACDRPRIIKRSRSRAHWAIHAVLRIVPARLRKRRARKSGFCAIIALSHGKHGRRRRRPAPHLPLPRPLPGAREGGHMRRGRRSSGSLRTPLKPGAD